MLKPVQTTTREIPLIRTGPDFPFETLLAAESEMHALMDDATRFVPRPVLSLLDQISRRWLVRSGSRYLEEIDTIAQRIARPGAHYLSVNYEWGCTTGARPAMGSNGPELVRVLDWFTKGLGENIIAARVRAPAGDFVTLTWPGYTGVLQAMAAGRFAIALNQAPLIKRGGGLLPFDWIANKRRLWASRSDMPALVLREVFMQAENYSDARTRLCETPISTPAIFTVVGVEANETCVIERTESDARIIDGPAAAANAWQAFDLSGHDRGEENPQRLAQMMQRVVGSSLSPAPDFSWVAPPILNKNTRLAMHCAPRDGMLRAQGYESDGPATAILTHHRLTP